jgi:ribonucleoside-diphosphate reductase alpha chain
MTPRPASSPSPAAVLPEDLPRVDMSENARIILAKRYLKKDETGTPVEEPEQMFWRVARTIAGVDVEYGASVGRWTSWRGSSTG